MRFLSPQFLPLLWLALVPVALYLFRRKSRRVRVSTLLFFKTLAKEHQESTWMRRLKRWLSFLLTLLILCAPIFALTRLVSGGGGSQAKAVVILLDRSASMAAVDAGGVSRFDAAKSRLRGQLDALPESTPVALVASDARAEVIQPRSTNRRGLLRALDALTVRPVEGDPAAGLAAADRIAALETPAEIWHATDAGGAGPVSEGVTRVALDVALPAPVNAGITAFSVRKVPLLHARYQAFVQVAVSAPGDAPRTVRVEPRVGGVPLARRELSVAPGQTQGLTLELDATSEQVLEVAVELEGDVLPLDDVAVCRLPEPRPLVVAWFTPKPDPFTQLALKSLVEDGELEVFTGGPAQWPPQKAPDVAIFDGWLPAPWPQDLPAVVINPPGSAGPVKALALDSPVPRDDLRALDDEHPVLFRVSTSRVALTQTAVLDSSGSLQPLWMAGEQPLLLAGEQAGQRLVVMGFSPAISEQLPLTPAYPLLLGNSIFWTAEKADAARAPQLLKTGELVELGPGATEWRTLDAGRLSAAEQVVRGPSGMAELDRIGLWRDAAGTREGSSLLLSRQESVLPAAPEGTAGAEVAATSSASRWRLAGDLTRWFLWLALAALVVEAWLFHRHAVN